MDVGRTTQERHAGRDSLGKGSGEGKCMICLFQAQSRIWSLGRVICSNNNPFEKQENLVIYIRHGNTAHALLI